jgi:hypothetical protein
VPTEAALWLTQRLNAAYDRFLGYVRDTCKNRSQRCLV